MKLHNEFTVNVPPERAWEVLTDIPAIAPCLPGAELTGQEGDVYSGHIKVKVGPVKSEFTGTADIVVQDAEARHVEISASGRDSRGAGNASASITADMSQDGDGTKVVIDTDLKISGKVAQFGKGTMVDISEKLIGQFVECVEQTLLGEQVVDEVAAASADGGSADRPAAPPRPTPAPAQELDLLDVAGGAMLKRLAPVAGVIVLVVLLAMLLGGRSSD